MKKELLTLNKVSVSLDGEAILSDVSFTLCENEWLMVVGPNGAGKSTLVSAIGRTVQYSGDILLGSRNSKEIAPKEFARHVGFLSQSNFSVFDFTVREIVEMGRYCWRNMSTTNSKSAVTNALEITGLTKLADSPVTKISGGERQRAFLAQAFAQGPDILILDEPTNHLDLKYQEELLAIIDEWKNKPGHAVISVMHDITLAKKFGTNVLLMNEGKSVACGQTCKVLTQKNLQNAFDVDVEGYMKQILEVWS